MSEQSPVITITPAACAPAAQGRRALPRSEDRCHLLSPELQARLEAAIVAALLGALARITARPEAALEADLAAAVADFFPLYETRPIANNTGGALFNDSLSLYVTARLLAPRLIVESGSYQGHTAWLLRRACPEAEILTFDIDTSQLLHREPDVVYREGSWQEAPLPRFAPEEGLIWLDDHINQAARLCQAHAQGFRRALFDDNFPAHNLYATGGAPVPTLAMVVDETLPDGIVVRRRQLLRPVRSLRRVHAPGGAVGNDDRGVTPVVELRQEGTR